MNPYVSDVIEALSLLTDTDASHVQERVTHYSPRVLFGVLKMWLISNRWPVLPPSLYNSVLRLVVEDHISSDSTTKIYVYLQTLPQKNAFVLERIVRLCSPSLPILSSLLFGC